MKAVQVKWSPDFSSVETTSKDPKAFAVLLEGDLMEPEFRHHDRVVFEPGKLPENGDAVFLRVKDGGSVFGWYHRKGSTVTLTNGRGDTWSISTSAIGWAYPAVEIIRTPQRRLK